MADKRSKENTKAKQDFIAELVKADAAITMNEASKKVRAKFGTQIAYDKLREAFLNAGGKIDTRRGPKGARKGKAKAKGAGPKRYGKRSPQATKAKQDFVNELVKGNPDITMNEAGKRVRTRFGTQLAFDKLKEAFRAAGGKVGKPGRRAKPRPVKIDRRIGRRAADINAARTRATLQAMPKHVVIISREGDLETSDFATREQAVAYTRSKLQAGIAVSNISYYQRQPLEISVGV